MDQKTLAKFIDHTILKPEATAMDVENLCNVARKYNFATVCVNSWLVPTAKEYLADTDVKVCTVVGFPFGAGLSQAKATEAAEAVRAGADEVDMVINIGALKSGLPVLVENDILAVVKACQEVNPQTVVKVIIETALLTPEEKVVACMLAKQGKAHFVKTSTGFNGGGATVEDIQLMHRLVGASMGVKASGGIRDLATAQAMIDAGATRIGTSSGQQILDAMVS